MFENKDKIVIVMEYASRGDLYDYICDKKNISEREARHFFRQIVSAVHYCHQVSLFCFFVCFFESLRSPQAEAIEALPANGTCVVGGKRQLPSCAAANVRLVAPLLVLFQGAGHPLSYITGIIHRQPAALNRDAVR